MTSKCGGCQGTNCTDCGEHFHPWDGYHYCHVAARREIAARLAKFLDELETARAVCASGIGFHSTDCRTVKSLITVARNAIAAPDTAHWDWRPWPLVHDERVVGYSNRCCSPPILIQRPQPKPRRLVRRLTGLGWPQDNGRCAKGRLPLWTREAGQ